MTKPSGETSPTRRLNTRPQRRNTVKRHWKISFSLSFPSLTNSATPTSLLFSASALAYFSFHFLSLPPCLQILIKSTHLDSLVSNRSMFDYPVHVILRASDFVLKNVALSSIARQARSAFLVLFRRVSSSMPRIESSSRRYLS